jgi:hypothetical protein
MPINMHPLLLVLLLLVAADYCFSLAHAQALFDTPSLYFGGINNDVYVNWVNTELIDVRNNQPIYPHSFFLNSVADESVGVAVHYRVNATEQRLYLALAAQATGWFGFGLSENGGMVGSDVLIYEAQNPDILLDAHILDERYPVIDDCPSNWILMNFNVDAIDDGFLLIEVARDFDTGDLQDRRIVNDTDVSIVPHRLIAAWGNDTSYSYHGLTNRARGSIRWFQNDPNGEDSFASQMKAQADGSFELRANDYPIKPVETEYAYICFSYNDLIERGIPSDLDQMSMIAFEPIVDPRAVRHVQ